MTHRFIYYFLLIFTLGTFYSCNDEVAGGYKVKPVALGRLNNIAVIAGEEMWESPIKDSFDFYFGSAYPIMPRPEPMFDLRHFTVNDLDAEPLRKELRTYVLLANLSDSEAKTTRMVRSDLGEERYRKALNGEITSTVGKDKWAREQLIIYLMGKDREALAKAIRENYPAVARRINKHDENQLKASIYAARSNAAINNDILERYGLEIDVPRRYEAAIYDEEFNFTWIRKDEKDYVMNMMFSSFSYSDPSQLNKEELIKYRNILGEKYITSTEENSFMVVNDEDLPVYDYTYRTNNIYTREIRGIWEMVNDYLGGPFASYAFLNEEKGEVIFIDTFIYAPGKEKRDMMQQMEYIVKGVKLP